MDGSGDAAPKNDEGKQTSRRSSRHPERHLGRVNRLVAARGFTRAFGYPLSTSPTMASGRRHRRST